MNEIQTADGATVTADSTLTADAWFDLVGAQPWPGAVAVPLDWPAPAASGIDWP